MGYGRRLEGELSYRSLRFRFAAEWARGVGFHGGGGGVFRGGTGEREGGGGEREAEDEASAREADAREGGDGEREAEATAGWVAEATTSTRRR